MSIRIVAPGDDGAVGFEGKGVYLPCSNGFDSSEAGRNIGLTIQIVTPGDDGAVGFEGE